MALRNTYIHYEKNKDTPEWYHAVATLVCNNGGCVNLLAGKRIHEIDSYKTGDIDMKPFDRMFKSENKKIIAEQKRQGYGQIVTPSSVFNPYPMIVSKRNVAAHLVHKTRLNLKVTATDVLALEKRDKDLRFLKERPQIQAIQQEMADMLSQGDVDAGTTKHSLVPYKEPPFGLNLDDSADAELMKRVVYKFKPEAAYEFGLNKISKLKRFSEVELLESYDTIDYGVCCHDVIMSKTTGIPNKEHIHPQYLNTPVSKYKDFRDIPYGWRPRSMTPHELHDNFADDFGDAPLDVVLNIYCENNRIGRIAESQFNTISLDLREIQFITIDGLHIAEDEEGNKRFVEADKSTYTTYLQNTVKFYWLYNTKYFFDKEKLGFSYRTKGQEAFTTTSWNIYKSQEKSPVELSIYANKTAIIASLKLQYAVIKSAGSGMVLDYKFVRKVVETAYLQDGMTPKEKSEEIIDQLREQNFLMIDTEGFDGDQINNTPPIREIGGGLKQEIIGYFNIIDRCSSDISKFTGINDEVAGMNNDADLLNGARRMLVNSSINAINYAYIAKETQARASANVIAYYIKEAIEKGGKDKEVFERFIGIDRASTIDDFGDIKNHTFDLDVQLGMNDQEVLDFKQGVQKMFFENRISHLEKSILDDTENIKDAQQLVNLIEYRNKKILAEQRQAEMQNMQQIQGMKSETLLNVERVKSSGKQEQLMTQAEMTAKLMQLGQELGASEKQMEAWVKNNLQERRLRAGKEGKSMMIQSKIDLNNLEKQQPLP